MKLQVKRLHLILVVSLVTIYAPIGIGQKSASTKLEYGDISEIANKHKAYVAAVSPDSRKIIIGELEKSKVVQVVQKPAEADFIISFVSETREAGISNIGPPLKYKMMYFGFLKVYTVKAANQLRIVWENRVVIDLSTMAPILRAPEVDQAKGFISALEKVANPDKK